MSFRKMVLGGLTAAAVACGAQTATAGDRETVAALDVAYQEAVKRSDVAAMAKFLHDDFFQVFGDGSVVSKAQLIARIATIKYEQQDEEPGTQIVRLYGDTAVVTAKIWVKGARANGETFDRRVWFSDTYVRTPTGWKYAFAQVGTPN